MSFELMTLPCKGSVIASFTNDPLYSYQGSNLELTQYQCVTLPLSYMSKCTAGWTRTIV